MKTPLIYVAGPYRAPSRAGIEANIQRARGLGVLVAQAGAYPVIPHMNTAHFDGVAPDELFLDGTLRLAAACDALMLVENWENSVGTKGEVQQAKALGQPVFDDIEELKRWLVNKEHAEKTGRSS